MELIRQGGLYDQPSSGFVLDAIEYDLHVTMPVSELRLRFWNPVSSPFTDLEVAIWSVAAEMLAHEEAKVHKRYVQTMRTSIHVRHHSFNA